jgi:uncharacterized protein (TIGR02284 family)
MPNVAETISGLHTQLVDAVKGYEEAQELAKRDRIGELCGELRSTHLKHAHELAGLLLENGDRPDADGSYMAFVHKAALNVRFAITADEGSLLPGLRDGEKRIVASYDDALRESEVPDSGLAAHAKVLARQRKAVLENIARIDALAADA